MAQHDSIVKEIDQVLKQTPYIEQIRESISRSNSQNKGAVNRSASISDTGPLTQSVVHNRDQQSKQYQTPQTNAGADPYVLNSIVQDAQRSGQSLPYVTQPSSTYKSSLLTSSPKDAGRDIPSVADRAAGGLRAQTALSAQPHNQDVLSGAQSIQYYNIENNVVRRLSVELAPKLISEISSVLKQSMDQYNIHSRHSVSSITNQSGAPTSEVENMVSQIKSNNVSQLEAENYLLRQKYNKRNIIKLRQMLNEPWMTRDDCQVVIEEVFKYRK